MPVVAVSKTLNTNSVTPQNNVPVLAVIIRALALFTAPHVRPFVGDLLLTVFAGAGRVPEVPVRLDVHDARVHRDVVGLQQK